MRKLFRVLIPTLLLGLVLPATVSFADTWFNGCPVFPPDNPWNTDISGAAVDPNSTAYINTIGRATKVHPDFGSDPSYGIPYFTVSGTPPKVPISFDYSDESDPGPYPFPSNAPMESGGDHHVIAIDTTNCVLYETWDTRKVGSKWAAGSGAIFDLNSNALRPDGYTSADAAGLPIFPGLARCAEANSGTISHALRFTVSQSQNRFIHPATHAASSSSNPNYPPMGQRFRLKAIALTQHTFTGQALAIATALTKYGLILADNGSNWYISGETNPGCWHDTEQNDELSKLKELTGDDFDAIVSPTDPTVVVPAPALYLPTDTSTITSTQPVLDWNTVTSATSYDIQLGRSIPTLTTVANVSSTQLTEYIPTPPLLAGLTYYWQVRAKVGNTPTGWSSPRSFTVGSATGAAPLRNVFTTGNPTLTWNRVTWAINYKIQVSSSSTFSNPIEKQVAAPALTYTLSSPTLSRGIYYWRVAAQDPTLKWGSFSPADTFVIDV